MFVFTFHWIQGLILFVVLAESWVACQDAEVLLESPSAMAGVHIAEALSTFYPLFERYCIDAVLRYSVFPDIYHALDKVRISLIHTPQILSLSFPGRRIFHMHSSVLQLILLPSTAHRKQNRFVLEALFQLKRFRYVLFRFILSISVPLVSLT